MLSNHLSEWPWLRRDRQALILGKDTLSYGQLLHHVNRMAANLRKAGLGPGESLAVAVRAPGGHIAMTLAAASLGVVTIGILGAMKPDEIGSLAEHLGAGFLVHDREGDFDAGYPSCRGQLRFQQLARPQRRRSRSRSVALNRWTLGESCCPQARPGGQRESCARTARHWRAPSCSEAFTQHRPMTDC